LDNPEKFIDIPGKTWSKQKEILRSVLENQVTLVPSANATGKSEIAARIAWCFLFIYGPHAEVVTTAKTFDMLKNVTWTRIRDVYKHVKHLFPNDKINLVEFYPDPENEPKWYMVGLNPKIEGTEATGFQGHHTKHVLFIIDEGVNVSPAIIAATEGGLLAGKSKLLMIYNPTIKGTAFHMEKQKGNNVIKITAWDLFNSPEYKEDSEHFNELVSPEGVQLLIDKYGRDHPLVRSRVDAEYPAEDENSAVSYSKFEICRLNHENMQDKYKDVIWERVIFSWDVASKGNDSNTLGRLRIGYYYEDGKKIPINHYKLMKDWQGLANENIGIVHQAIVDETKKEEYVYTRKNRGLPENDYFYEDPGEEQIVAKFALIIDSVGVGDFAEPFMRNAMPALEIIGFMGGGGSEKDIKIEYYEEIPILNNTTEAWFYTGKLVDGVKSDIWGILCIECDDRTVEEVTTRKMEVGMKKKEPFVYFIEPKEKFKERNSGKSPDRGDAFVMSVYAKFKSGANFLPAFFGD